jgi:hypothetical protein
MAVRVDLYLRNRVVRGDLITEGARTLDHFNRRDPALTLENAQVASFHVATQPRPVGVVRVEKAQVLLVAPDDAHEQLVLRGAWQPRKRVLAEAGVGPLAVRGIFHLGQSGRQATLAHVLFGEDDRLFVPITDALVTCEYHTDWTVHLPTVFAMRRAIEFLTADEGLRMKDEGCRARGAARQNGHAPEGKTAILRS